MTEAIGAVPLPINSVELSRVVEEAKDWALMHGAGMRSKSEFNPDVMHFAPFILTPTVFPRREFEKACRLQPILNLLMHRVAYDAEFLRQNLANTIKVDDFTRRLYEIHEKILLEGQRQRISLGLLRSDVMLESNCAGECAVAKPYCCWKQVEINTIASGFGHLGPISRSIQAFVLQQLNHHARVANLPENSALSGLCEAMVKAWRIQGKRNAVILFVIEDRTYNICDQRFHEFEIRAIYPEVQVIRRTLTEIGKGATLGPNGELMLDGTEISVVYFRAGYEPGHYPSELEWDGRLLMERSMAIKCPSIQYHLAGTKKIQQALAKPGNLKRFLSDAEKVREIENIFTGLYSLDGDTEAGREAFGRALETPERYVLKPQREGGGNNVYGEDIPPALRAMSEVERSSWILMDRIMPPVNRGYMIRPSAGEQPPELVDLVSELGIFGAIIGDENDIIHNTQCGHMLRTKLATADEGGVAAGLGALDSPYLFDD